MSLEGQVAMKPSDNNFISINFTYWLENMAGEKLPFSLLLFQIQHCPLPGKRYKKKNFPGHQEIDNCYAGGFAFFLVSTIKMCIRQLPWQLQLGEHLKRNATMLDTSLCIHQAGSYHSPSTLRQEENGIQELVGLVNLHGTFEIKKLENVVEGKEARNARIIDKKHIDYLLLKWCSDDDMVSSTQTERDILDSLRPHHGLKELAIDGYRNTIFPDWVGHSSYQNMTCVSLVYCKNCCMLPSLGQMPSLKSLWIQGLISSSVLVMSFDNLYVSRAATI
ncbi:hypothetical protein Ahy_A02g009870 isoform A [Arachis hypogaea]|uniref:R13L1/DRL21-like LRR repeat region domain-containing protein n=1 Tax=Arachis hypogaea TaxID=3818 RepID=A0A445EIF6_ARAHY|nr:hypothetical protein Ahy_A02g009870 isoform A [Arachis hypogaea]